MIKEPIYFEPVYIVSGYHEEPIYAEDNVTVIEPAGLQMKLREIGVTSRKVDFIASVNSGLERIFSDSDKDKRQPIIDAMMMTYAHSGIVDYYAWLLDYMSLPALVFLKNASPRYSEQIGAAIEKLEKGNQKTNTAN